MKWPKKPIIAQRETKTPITILSSSSSTSIPMATALLIPSPRPPAKIHDFTRHQPKLSPRLLSNRFKTQAVQETKEKANATTQSSADEITEKYGLEVGLWKIFSSKSEGEGKEKSKTDQAKELLAKYGGAYLATSIALSLDLLRALLRTRQRGNRRPNSSQQGHQHYKQTNKQASNYVQKIQGFKLSFFVAAGWHCNTDEAGGKVGTFAVAYAANKAASPIRFPPTVALTPIVAGWIGKKTEKADK